ncbi:MAG: UDP-N-acetylglucosamine 1-carboxyvinyltransferase [Prevotella sp.]|nr:UDP-N-acetylglucosamine 1-carboxyvinyltransferase [Prevotella sp.]
MSAFIIEGGHALKGTIRPQGAKNEALQVICATLLTASEVTIRNIPNIRDVNNLIQLLRDIGVSVQTAPGGALTFQAATLNLEYLQSDEFVRKCAQLRGSVLMIGPLLARFGRAVVAKPGGDKIGRRRLDTHFLGFQKLGATFQQVKDRDVYEITAQTNAPLSPLTSPLSPLTTHLSPLTTHLSPLKGTYMLLDEASVTGTANIVMAAVLAEGTTTIYNAACEPYVQQLCRLLQQMGARISGIGSNLLTIKGVSSLHGAEHTVLPDMIEVGSFIGMAAICGEGIRIKDASVANLGLIPEAFRRLGVKMRIEGDDIVVPHQRHYEVQSFIDGTIMTLADAPWPGLTPDLLSVLITVATQARGSVLIHQKMFESRLFFVDKLIDMGAQIILCDPHRAVVVGHDRKIQLRAQRMSSPDIRAGIALLIAAMSAHGTSRIDNIEQIDRGYENIEHRLNALGARITREQ